MFWIVVREWVLSASKSFSGWNEEIFISEMEWTPFKFLFWNANHSILKLIASTTSNVSLL